MHNDLSEQVLSLPIHQKLLTMTKHCFWLLALAAGLPTDAVQAQVTERERPAEWADLAEGASYKDRFQPMPAGKLSDKVSGAADVRPGI